MKYLIAFCILMFAVINVSFADNRMEAKDNLSHVIMDLNNDDNELYLNASCEPILQEKDGVYRGELYCDWFSKTIPWEDYFPNSKTVYLDNTKAVGIPCVMVSSNYNAGADADNRNQYVSNEWNSIYKAVPAVSWVGFGYNISVQLICENGV